MSVHPLRLAYITLVKERYGVQLGGDRNPQRTEIVAQKIMPLGLDYAEFVDIATSIWHIYAKKKGWLYPYWNVVTSDATLERIRNMLDLTEDSMLVSSEASVYEAEMTYAFAYVQWMIGQNDNKPKRLADSDVDTRIKAAEYICTAYGIPFITSNLNHIAKQLEEKLAR